jgi:Bifunctional DNA primase/polymerase, N-terminal
MFLDAADRYISLGFKVFPLGHGSKLPAIKGGKGFKDATDDHAKIDAWVKAFPKCNIAIATGEPSGIVVIDVDPRNGGFDTLSKLAGGGNLFPPRPTAKTGNNGRHMYFRLPPGLKSSKDRLGPGIDIKSTGGYVVAAPSWIAPTDAGPGGSYQWLISPETTPIPMLPRWVIERLIPAPKAYPKFESVPSAEVAQRSLEGMARRLASAGKGQRNNLLNWAAFNAGALIREGKLSGALADHRLTQAALAAGLDISEIKATIASGFRGGAGGN